MWLGRTWKKTRKATHAGLGLPQRLFQGCQLHQHDLNVPISPDQLSRIESVFDNLKDERNLLNFKNIIDLLGHYAPDAVLKRLFSSHKQTTSDVTLNTFLRFLRFLLNGTKQDRIQALCYYYTCGQCYVSMDSLKDTIEQEEWSMDKFGLVNKKETLSYDRLNEYFLQSHEATNVSKWLLGSRLTIASGALTVDEETLRAEYLEFKRIAVCDEYLISQSSFRSSLIDIFPDSFITGLFKFFDVNNDGYIDVMELYKGLAFLPHASIPDCAKPTNRLTKNLFTFSKGVFYMFSSQTQSGIIFNSNDFDNTLRCFVPPRVLKEASVRISGIKGTTLTKFTAWAENNPAFVHLIEFLKAITHVVFGLPLSASELETSKVIMLWLHYLIVQPPKQGSQWFVVSSQHWPSLVTQGSELGLKLPRYYKEYDSYHPISLYKKVFTTTTDPIRRVPLRQTSPPNRMRSSSFAEDFNAGKTEKSTHHGRTSRWLSKSRSLHHGTPCSSLKSSQEEIQEPSIKPSKEPAVRRETVQTSPIAVDRRLAERLQCWSGLNPNNLGINGKGQLMPSYLILYTSMHGTPKNETLELYPLQISVYWTMGGKPKVSSPVKVITDVGVPKNPQFCAPQFAPTYSEVNEKATTSEKKRPAKKRLMSNVEKPSLAPTWRERRRSRTHNPSHATRSVSVPGKKCFTSNLDCTYVPPERLSEQSVRFAFSRCHTISEVCEAVSREFTNYRSQDLTPDTYRVWFVKATETVDTPRQKQKMSQITKPASLSPDTNTSDDEKASGSPNTILLAKRVVLAPVDCKTIGSQQLGRFLADQDPLAQYIEELLNPHAECSKTFEFIIECLHQANYWPLGQCRSEVGPFVGLKNMGNTCYFNSVIQCLRVTPLLEHRIRSCVTPQTKLANEYIKLLDHMVQEGSANPRILWHAFVQKAPAFGSFVQQDAHEFLIIFLDLLSEELKHKNTSPKDGLLRPHDSRRKSTATNHSCTAAQKWSTFCAENDSPVTSIFYGLCESRCQFEECSHQTSSFDFFASLTLPLPVDEIKSIVLTVVSSYVAVPEKCRLQSEHSLTLHFIRQQISKLYKCLPDQVFLALYSNETLMPLPNPTTESGKVNGKFNYWAFILPPRCSGSTSDREMLVIVQNRILVPIQAPLLEETADQRELHGSPIVLRLSPSTTNKELYEIVEKSISQYRKSRNFKTGLRFDADESGCKTSKRVDSASKTSEFDYGNYFFVLKQAEKHFWRCSRCCWPKMCRGCPIPCTSEKVDLQPFANGCIYIAADWSLEEFVNNYQPIQGVTQKMDDTIGSPDSDTADAIQLSSLIHIFFEEELVTKSDGIVCNYCQRRKSFTVSTMLCELPEVLLISLKRFHATNRGWRKSSNLVHFPLTSLDMRTYLSKEVRCENTIYDLYAVVNHMGKLNEGHYYAFIRVEDGRWFRVNDMQYSEVRKESVVTPDAYILFYQRRKVY
ncbi:hypothetical protein TcWFU_008680 [Taenia crassiceps]|uniref:ubiquitinyl hydrolase 1 n=1 Tax=Taenia crassiceps TaxID=6207 RepID=A0ABR4Q4S1_9CEST